MSDALDEYYAAYDRHEALKERRKKASKLLTKAKDALESFYAGLGVTSMTRDGRAVGVSFKRYSKVEDFDALDEYKEEQGEPESEYMDRVFRKDALKQMLDEATEEALAEGKSVHECLPPGLSFYMKTVVTVRKSSKADTPEPVTLVDMYKQMMEEE